MNRRTLMSLVVVVGCSGQPDSAATTVAEGASSATPPLTTATTTPLQPPPRPDTGVITTEKELPPSSYEGVPGWFVMGGRGFWRHIGDSTDTDQRANTGVDADSGIVIFPYDARWARVGTATPLALLEPDGPVTLYPGAAAEENPFTPATLLRTRALPPVEIRKLSMGWMIPAGRSPMMTALAIRDSVAADSSTHTWTMDSVRFRIRLTGRQKAAFWAAHVGGDSTLLFRPAVDSAADSGMGVESDSVLTLASWEMPNVVAAFRLGDRWPVVAIVYSSGYECGNYRVVVFRAGSITAIDEPHYYECQR